MHMTLIMLMRVTITGGRYTDDGSIILNMHVTLILIKSVTLILLKRNHLTAALGMGKR